MYEYCVEKEVLYNYQLGRYVSYGIGVYLVKEKSRKRLEYVSDVFLSEKEALSFVRLCNSLDLEPVHLPEAIEEALLSGK